MNALRNIFTTSARGLTFLRQNGTNSLFNLTQQPVDGIAQQSYVADVGDNDKNEQQRIAKPSLIPKSILESTTFKGKQLAANGAPGSLSPTSLNRLRSMQQKVELAYICKICNTRNIKEVSEAAYKNGVVILQCDGCAVNHLICDNLGWFANARGKNFEQVLSERASERRVKVIKVNEHGELI